ncbi:MAG: NADH-quinone oxidoreductase subunit C [Spirochaetota bacterium]
MQDEKIKQMCTQFACTLPGHDEGFYGTRERKDLLFVTVEKYHAVPLITWLNQIAGFRHLVLFTAVDMIEQGYFQLTYLLHSHEAGEDVCVLVHIDREGEQMDSIHHLWPHAATYQQELYEMFGITFPGSPRLYEDFALEGWDNLPPMRREFDTKQYSQQTYYPRPGRETNDTTEYMKKQLYPGEAETW